MSNAYIYDAGRTAFGRYGGLLSTTRPDDLLGHVIKTLVQRNDFDLSDVRRYHCRLRLPGR